jgi:hypothetical protein
VYISGKWIGFGPGVKADPANGIAYVAPDVDPKVLAMKTFLHTKFKWVRDWPTPLVMDTTYDWNFAAIVSQMQANYGIPVTGIMNAATQEKCGFYKPTPVNKINDLPVMFTVCGTGVPYWVGPDADLARDLEYIYKEKPNGQYRWQPIGYPAAPVPMGKSINEGKAQFYIQADKLRDQIVRYGCVLVGYSQGAVITSELWEFDIKPENGRLHWMKDHVFKAVTFGNPSRELGRVWPDFAPGQEVAPANTSGVAYPPDRLKDTPPWWRDYAHKGDLYAAAEQGASGQDKTAIWRVIRGEKFFVGPDTLLEQVGEVVTNPGVGIVGMFKAMMDAMTFFGKKLTPHTSYNPWVARDYLRN